MEKDLSETIYKNYLLLFVIIIFFSLFKMSVTGGGNTLTTQNIFAN